LGHNIREVANMTDHMIIITMYVPQIMVWNSCSKL